MSAHRYPEHLNPFNEPEKKHSSLKNSFRELKRTIRQSFRRKKEADRPVVLRRHQDTTLRPTRDEHTVSHPPPLISPPLPRSRFQDRVQRAQTYAPPGRNNADSGSSGHNPFEHDEANRMLTHRRRKKKAPLPPHLSASQTTLDTSSKWSLSSVGTDCSYSTENLSENDSHVLSNDVLKMDNEFKQFNEDMQKLKDDESNNNVISTTEDEESKNAVEENKNQMVVASIPDVIVSCASDVDKIETKEVSTVQENTQTDVIEAQVVEDKPKTEEGDEMKASEIEETPLHENTKVIEEENSSKCEEGDEKKVIEIEETPQREENNSDRNLSTASSYDNIPKKSSSQDIKNTSYKNTEDQVNNNTEGKENLIFNERTSLYINKSKEDLTKDVSFRKSVCLFIDSSTEELNNNENNTEEKPDNTKNNSKENEKITTVW